MPKTYMLRNVPDDLWMNVKARAAQEGRPLRFVLLGLLAAYARVGYGLVDTPQPPVEERLEAIARQYD